MKFTGNFEKMGKIMYRRIFVHYINFYRLENNMKLVSWNEMCIRDRETYLFDCKEDLYGEECRVDFKKFLRPERKFPSLEALKSRLLADAEDGRRFFEKTEK